MNTLVLIIGGNLGDRLSYLRKAEILLSSEFGNKVRSSSIFETEAWGGFSEGSYLNQVLVYETAVPVELVLKKIQKIELLLDRKRVVKWGNRTMDIDILYYGNMVLNSVDLRIPHPFLAERRFVLEPLAEVLPDFIHPILKISSTVLLSQCQDNSNVFLYKRSPEYPG